MMAKQLNIRLSPELHEQAKCAAEQQQISLNQFCMAAISRAVGEAQARRFFAARGRGLSPETAKRQFLAVLEKVQD